MRGGWRTWALLAGLMLFVGACTPICTNKTASVTTVPSPSAAASPLALPTPSPIESPSPTPTPTLPPSPTPTPAPAKLIIVNFSLQVGEVGIGYAPVTIGASGGTPPYKWSIDGGALPTGLAFSSGGTLSGTPGTSGGFSFVVRVDDAAGQAAGVQRSITVVPYLTASGLCTQSCAVEVGCVTVCGTYADLAGGVTPYSFALNAGSALPPGMSLNGASLAGAFPAGQLSVAGAPLPYGFAVTVTDAFGATSQVTSSFSVFPHLAFPLPATTVCGNSPSSCALQIPYSGGIPGGTPTVMVTVTAGAMIQLVSGGTCQAAVPTTNPPPGMVATASSNVMMLSAGPSPGPTGTWCSYSGTITFVLVDQSLCGPGTLCPISNTLSVLFGL